MRVLSICVFFWICGCLSGNGLEQPKDIGTWAHVRATRPTFYDRLFLCSLNEVTQQFPGATITRLVVADGWAAPLAVTVISLATDEKRVVKIEASSTLRSQFVARCRIDNESVEAASVFKAMAALDKNLPWKSRESDSVGDDESCVLFEHYSESDQGFTIKTRKAIKGSERQAIDDLCTIVKAVIE